MRMREISVVDDRRGDPWVRVGDARALCKPNQVTLEPLADPTKEVMIVRRALSHFRCNGIDDIA